MVEQNRSGAYTQIVYAPTGEKLALMNGSTLQKGFAPLTGGAMAVYNSSGLAYYRHSDWIGSSRLASTPSRTLYSDGAYAPYGEAYAQTGATDLSFTGMNQDTAANLYDFPAREYGIQGRWPSPDPAGILSANPTDPQTWNRYAYVRNNPLSAIDPTGLDCVYFNDAGDGVESIDSNSNSGECGANGGDWVNGIVYLVQYLTGLDMFAINSMDAFAKYSSLVSAPGSQTDGVDCYGDCTYSYAQSPWGDTNFSWWGAFAKSFFTFAGGPGNVPTCAGQTLRSIANSFTGEPTGEAVSTALKAGSTYQTGKALQYAAGRTNSMSGTGLICPRCSGVFRGMMDKAEFLGDASEAVPLIETSIYASESIPNVSVQARNGTCAAAFPVF